MRLAALTIAASACWRGPVDQSTYVCARPAAPVQTCVGVLEVVKRAVERYWRTPPGRCNWVDGADDEYWFCRLNEVQEQAIGYYDLLVEVGELCGGKL